MNKPSDIYSVASVRKIDSNAIRQAGIDGYQLMTRAAQAALDLAERYFPEAHHWQIICGAGNNAGDGYVLARLAAAQGIAVSVFAAVSPDRLSGDAARAYRDFSRQSGAMHSIGDRLDDECELLVDALLGSGIDRPVAGRFAEVIDAVNRHSAPVLSLDLPSGLNGDTGAVMGCAVAATRSITFVARKPGLYCGAGPHQCGRLNFADLGIPRECYSSETAILKVIDAGLVGASLPPRLTSSHKGDFGHVLVIGGAPGMSGAAALCAEAALRGGAGRVSVATHPEHCASVVAGRPELMCHGIERPDELEQLIGAASVVALGPGLGVGDWSTRLFACAVRSGKPLVIDADGLNLLATTDLHNDHWVLTPHPGEAGRLLNRSAAAVQSDRAASTAELQARYGGTVVLKGHGTLISNIDGPALICTAGNPGMSTAGMGDVLCGIIAAFVAQGLPSGLAAVVGVDVHARAGDAAASRGERGLIASDVIAALRRQINFDRRDD